MTSLYQLSKVWTKVVQSIVLNFDFYKFVRTETDSSILFIIILGYGFTWRWINFFGSTEDTYHKRFSKHQTDQIRVTSHKPGTAIYE